MTVQILVGDCRDVLRTLVAESVQCCVTSQPYWGLRDYKIPPSIWGGDAACQHEFADERQVRELRKGVGMAILGQRLRGGGHKASAVQRITIERGFCIHCAAWRGCFGLEPTYQLYVQHTVEVFREVWRVLRKDGTLWLNMGDCYAAKRAGWKAERFKTEAGDDRTYRDKPFNTFTPKGSGKRKSGGKGITNNGRVVDWGYRSRAMSAGADNEYGPDEQPNREPQQGLKQKDLAGMPWRVAFTLQDDGWYLRRDIIWHKKNPMPESVYSRPTTSHEYIFLFSKSGSTLCWRHESGAWTWTKPAPDIYWRHRLTRETSATENAGKDWIKVNRWRGFDYYYDFAAIMEPSSPDSHARAARSRSKTHKWADGGPLAQTSQGGQSIAIGSPVAGRIPVPAGWAVDEDGHHGTIHPAGRRKEVGIGHNSRPSKAAPNGASRRALPAEWKQGGPNSRFHKDRVPKERKANLDYEGPRPKNNENWDIHLATADIVPMRNKRSVWSIATKPFKEAHFATFPPDLIEPCILAGCPKGGIILDPFGGAGTTGLVAELHGRDSVLVEINPEYAAMAEARIARVKMGPEEKKRNTIKANGKLKPTKGLPLFKVRSGVTRDSEREGDLP